MITLNQPIRVRFRNWKGEVITDTVRAFFTHTTLLEPYARNTEEPAVVLTQYSWIPLKDIIEFVEEVSEKA